MPMLCLLLQDLLRKQNPNQALPEFYNITLERPASNPGGYDVMFVEVGGPTAFLLLQWYKYTGMFSDLILTICI